MSRNELEPLMTPDEVAAVLRVSRKTVRNKAAAGMIPSVRVAGGVTRFRRADIAKLIEAAAADSTGQAA